MSSQMEKFKQLQAFRQKVILENLESVKQEEARKRTLQNEQMIERRKQKALKMKEKMEAEENDEDLERKKFLRYTAEEVQEWEKKQKKKEKRKDPGFSDYLQASIRKYKSLTKEIVPDIASYEMAKNSMGYDELYRDANSLSYNSVSTADKDKVDRMATDLNKQLDKRSKFSKRKTFKAEADVTYINERNERFNKKIGRSYDDYTKDIRDSLERGTAL